MTLPLFLALSCCFPTQSDPDRPLIASFAGHRNSVCSVAFSPDGKTLASGTWASVRKPGELKIWNIEKVEETATLPITTAVRGIEFSPDGKLMATAEHDKTAKLRDAKTGQVLRSFTGHSAGVDMAIFLGDGKTLATTGWDKTVKLWDVETAKELRSFTGHGGKVFCVARSPDSKVLASAGDNGFLKVWDAATAKELFSVKAHAGVVNAVAFADGGRIVATASWDKTVKLFDAKTGTELARLFGHSAQALALASSPDGKWLVSGSGLWDGADGKAGGLSELILWDVSARKLAASVDAHKDRISGVAFSADSQSVATASSDGLVKLWSVKNLLKSAAKK